MERGDQEESKFIEAYLLNSFEFMFNFKVNDTVDESLNGESFGEFLYLVTNIDIKNRTNRKEDDTELLTDDKLEDINDLVVYTKTDSRTISIIKKIQRIDKENNDRDINIKIGYR